MNLVYMVSTTTGTYVEQSGTVGERASWEKTGPS